MRGSTKRLAAAVCCAALVAAACSGDDEPDATAPVPTANDEEASPTMEEAAGDAADDDEPGSTDAPDVESDATVPTPTDPPDTNAPPTDSPDTTAVDAAPERRLPEDLGPVTDSIPYPDAPGVEAPGEFYEIYEMGYVYLPLEDDPNDPTIVAPTDEELPIIAAYAASESAVAEATFVERVSPEPTPEIRDAYADRGESFTSRVLVPWADDGRRNAFLFDAPDIYRPRVEVGDDGVSAVVVDCSLLSSATVDANGQPTFAEIRPYFEFGVRTEFIRVNGEWKISDATGGEVAC